MRLFWVLLLCFLTIYAPLELTRIIVLYWRFVSLPFRATGLREIALLWAAYLIGMIIIYKKMKG